MAELKLVRPDVRYQASFIASEREFMTTGERRPIWQINKLERHFDEFVKTLLARATDPLAGMVPQTDYWLVVDGLHAGNISVRHHLNDALRRYGGHIGYEIRPSMRRKGYGTRMCALAIEKARERGITRILITCDDDNIGSYKIIEANGGILADKINTGRRALTRRYWVDASG